MPYNMIQYFFDEKQNAISVIWYVWSVYQDAQYTSYRHEMNIGLLFLAINPNEILIKMLGILVARCNNTYQHENTKCYCFALIHFPGIMNIIFCIQNSFTHAASNCTAWP